MISLYSSTIGVVLLLLVLGLEFSTDELAAEPDLTLLYLEGTDAVGHVFAHYLPPPMPGVSETEIERYSAVPSRYHRWIDEILGTVGLADAADRRTGTYSGGMRQRLGIDRQRQTGRQQIPASQLINQTFIGEANRQAHDQLDTAPPESQQPGDGSIRENHVGIDKDAARPRLKHALRQQPVPNRHCLHHLRPVQGSGRNFMRNMLDRDQCLGGPKGRLRLKRFPVGVGGRNQQSRVRLTGKRWNVAGRQQRGEIAGAVVQFGERPRKFTRRVVERALSAFALGDEAPHPPGRLAARHAA